MTVLWLPIGCLWLGALLGFIMGVFLVGCREAAHSREDDLLIKPKRREAVDDLMMQMGMPEQHPVSVEDLAILSGSEGDNLPRTPNECSRCHAKQANAKLFVGNGPEAVCQDCFIEEFVKDLAEDPPKGSFVLGSPEQFILSEISNTKLHQKDIAKTYAMIMRDNADEVDWKKINEAIIGRWSVSGLNRVKSMAHSGKCWN